MITRLHVPLLDPRDVIPHLGAPHHYAEGRSARLIAETWFSAGGLPIMIEHILKSHETFSDVALVEAFLERGVDLGDTGRPSQADVLAVLSLPSELAVMAVEGKVDESFGPRVSEWLVGASRRKLTRLGNLCALLGLDVESVGHIRYQLIHRTAAALIETKRYRGRVAVMMVHSFDPADAGALDFVQFAAAIGLPDAGPARVVGPLKRDEVDLYLGWTADRPSNEGFVIVGGRKTDAAFHAGD